MGGRGDTPGLVLGLFGLLRIVAGTTAEAFLLNPANHVRRAILDRNISCLGRTKKHHRLAVHKSHVGEIEGNRLRLGTFGGKCALHFRKIFLSELTAQAHPEGLFIFPSWRNL